MTFANFVYGVVVPIVDRFIIPLMYSLAFLFFLYGIVRLMFSSNEETRQEGRQFAFWGIIGLAVLFAVWGIVRVLLNSLFAFTV